MRIAMIGSRGIPAHSGGVERVVEELTRELASRGHEVLVYCRGHYVRGLPKPDIARQIVTPGLGGRHFDTITHTATAMLDVLGRGVDVVHIHSPGPAILSWIPAARHLPVVLTVHAPDWQRDKWSPWARAMLRLGLACGMKLAAEVTAVGWPLTAELSGRFGRPVHYVPNGVRCRDALAPKEILRWGLGPDGYVLYVGRIEPEKRLDLLLAAWSRTASGRPLVVVGDAQENAYARSCRRQAGENVLLVGPQHGRALEELYSNAALVVQPSVLEGMSLVLLEAASFGRCVLASDIAANVETLGPSAVYFPVDDVSELAGQIRRCLEREELRLSVGQQAKDWVRTRHEWRTAADRMERIYVQAAKRVR